MYLFDREEFNCNEIPTTEKWEDYANTLRGLYDVYMRCISNYIRDNQSTIPPSVLSDLNSLFTIDLINAYNDVKTKLQLLIDELTTAPVNCFNKLIYADYTTSYSNFKAIAKNIDILIGTGGETIGIQPDISVSLTTIYPTDGITPPKTSTCVGVYMKQMDNGSEFRGKVSDDRIVYNNSVPSDGRIIIS